MPKRHFSKLTDFISSDLSKHLHGVGSGSLSQKSDVKSSLEAQNTWKDICRRDKDISRKSLIKLTAKGSYLPSCRPSEAVQSTVHI